MGKILAGGAGKINLQMIRTEKSREKGLWKEWIWFLSKRAETRREGRRGKIEVHKAMFPFKWRECHLSRHRSFLNIKKSICAFMSFLPEEPL